MTRMRDEAGAALVMTILMGAILAATLAMVADRSASQFSNAAGDSCWEASLSSAESALNWGMAQIEASADFSTGTADLSDFVGTGTERSAVLGVADGVTSDQVMSFPGGEAVFLRAEGSAVVHAVGFCPDRGGDSRRARVIRVALESESGGSWIPTHSFLSGGNLTISGNPTFQGTFASVHANGSMTVSGNPTFHGGCVTASGGGSVSGNANVHAVCPPTNQRFAQPLVTIPEVVPRASWHLSEYDLCPDGSVRAGPAHATLGITAGAEPCTGHVLAANASSTEYRGWMRTGSSTSQGATWDYEDNTSNHGSYYVYQGSASVSGNAGSNNNPWRVVIVAEGSGQCPSIEGGDIEMAGNMVVAPYWNGATSGASDLTLMAGRDLEWSENGGVREPGVVAAHEQVSISGNLSVDGIFIAESACDTSGSPVTSSVISGNPTVRSDAGLEADFPGGSGGAANFSEWSEVR